MSSSSGPNRAIAIDMARAALTAQREDEVLPVLEALLARSPADARLWQWTALLQRELGNRAEAGEAMMRASRLAPSDAGIAHGLARIALEAGADAVDLFVAAQRLAPQDPMVSLGLSAARLGNGDVAGAVREVEQVLADHPRWTVGHQQLAQIRWMSGERKGFADSFERALSKVPSDEDLWRVKRASN